MNILQHRYAIVVGESKAGTSSIYRYLGDHPEIQPTTVKQADYFLSDRYQWKKTTQIQSFERDKGQSYMSLFGRIPADAKCLLDVSPDYMYCKETPGFLHNYLRDKEYCIIFILRDPIQRLMSWYRFGKQIQMIPSDMDFATFLDRQGQDNNKSMAFDALETGKFLRYVTRFESIFPDDSIVKLSYEQLKSAPEMMLSSLANKLGVTPSFYNDYAFSVHNKSQNVRFRGIQKLYLGCQRSLHRLLKSNSYLEPIVRYPVMTLTKIYRRTNLVKAEDVEIDKATMARLREFYADEYKFLKTLRLN